MELIHVAGSGGFFDVVAGTKRSQAATMTLEPGQVTGGPENAHRASDQWLYVIAGRGSAVIENETHDIEVGDLVLIEPGETHEIRADETEPLATVNVYAPPEY